MEKRSTKSGNSGYTYGYRRLSFIGVLVNAMVLTVGSVLIVIPAVPRIFSPEPLDAGGMFLLAIIGIIVNVAAVLRPRGGSGISDKVVSLHLLEDVLGWVAVLIVSIVLLFADIPVLDPILSLLMSAFVLRNIVMNFHICTRATLIYWKWLNLKER